MLFRFEKMMRVQDNIVYTRVRDINKKIQWRHGNDEIECVRNIKTGEVYFGEYIKKSCVYNKSQNFVFKTLVDKCHSNSNGSSKAFERNQTVE